MSTKPDNVKQLLKAAMKFHQQGNYRRAESLYRHILQLDPDNADVFQLLGLIAHQHKKYDIAVQLISKAIDINPGRSSSYYNLGNAFLALGKIGAAENSFRRAAKINPNLAEAHYKLGKIFLQQDNPIAAEQALRQAIRIRPDYIGAHNNLGNALQAQGDLTGAEESFRRVLDIRPELAETNNNLGNLFMLQDRPVVADQAFRRAVSIDPDFAVAYRHIAYLYNQVFNQPYYFKDHEYFKKVKELLNTEKNTSENSIDLHVALGEMYDNCKMYDEAFTHFHQANLLKHEHMNFNFSVAANQTEEIISIFSNDIFSHNDIEGSNSSRPVFITGLPRSGKSLVERLLAVHPHFFGCGELVEIDRLIYQEIPRRIRRKINYPALVKYLDNQTALEIADEYEKYLISIAGQSPQRVSNTFPYSYKLLGILVLLFPRAKIIYCRRNPLDNCLAIYFKDFMEGHEYAYDLNEIGLYTRQCEKLMDHWQKVLPSKIYEMKFEELLNNPTDEILELTDFLELDTDTHFLAQLKNALSPDTSTELHSPLDIKHPRGAGWSINYRKFLEHLENSFKKHSDY